MKRILNELRELKIKDLNNKEKKFIVFTIIYIIFLISLVFIHFSIYAKYTNYHQAFDKYRIFKDSNIYIPNLLMLKVMKTTPIYKAKVLKISSMIWFIGTMLWIYLAFPLSKISKNVQGDARWASFDDLGYKRFFVTDKYAKPFETNFLEDTGVVVGEYNGRLLHDNAKTHILLSAPTRTGKGVSIIIPTLVDSWKDSVLVLDVKGENLQMTGGWRQKEFDNTILKFSPKKEDSCYFNPLQEIRYLSNKESEDAKTIADLIVQDDTTSDKFWSESGSAFLLGVIIFVLYEKNGNGCLSDVVNFITDPSSPIEKRIQRYLTGESKMNLSQEVLMKLEEIYPTEKDIIKRGIHPLVARNFADILSKGDKTMASIIATAKAKLNVFEMPTVAEKTSKSDFRIKDLMAADKPISLYIVIEPGDLQSLAPLLRILIIQCVTLLTPEIDYTGNNKNAVKFKHRLLMLLDEFPAIGKMEILEKAIGYVAGYGMKMMIVVQSLDQLNKIYTKDNAFMSNCQTQIFYTANDNQTAEYVSKTVGNKTVKVFNKSGGKGLFASTTNTSEISVPLIRPEEVRQLPLDKILILNAGKPPIKSKKILYFNDDRFKHKVKLPINEN